MKSSRRLRPFLNFSICCVLLTASLTPASAPWTSAAQGQRVRQPGRGKRVRPEPAQPGAPAASLPDLDSVRNLPQPAAQAPPPVPSAMRSRRKPLVSRGGRRVGDPLPLPTVTPLPIPTTTPPIPVPTPAVPTPTPLTQGAGGAGFDSFTSPNYFVGAKGSALYFARFLVSPLYDGLGTLPGSLSPFNQGYGLNASFDFFVLAVPQAGGARIVFSSNRDGNVQIYTMNADGTGQVRLTNNSSNDDAPRFSPNGTKVIFQSDRDNPSTGASDIYVMNADGTNQQRLTTDPSDDCAPSWSPDGSRIVFQSLRNGQFYQVYSMNADGSNQVNLSNSTGGDRQPSWSPDGAKIAFASERDHAGYASVYVMNANGMNQQRLTFGAEAVTDEQPVWSRDGDRIAFVSTRDSEVESWQETDEAGGVIYRTAVRINKEVYVMNADGTGQTRLTNSPGNDDAPSWSPDGAKIVFRSDRERDWSDPTSQVWVMNADGTGAVNLSGNSFGDYGASWTSGGGNQPPVADAGGSYSGITGQNTVFSGSGSFDPDGSITSYSWNFGDGGAGSGASLTHAYSSPGTYTVTLTVTDNLGAQGSNSTTVNISSSSSDQFVQNFLQWGLARQPGGDEGSYWTDIFRAAYPKGQATMLLAMREFGMTVFESAEYAARNRSDHWYVYDLYRTYLMRDPDPEGWAWWESRVPEMGREQLRNAFDESIEFGQIVATLTASGPPSSAASSLATARADLFNQTGDQMRARDCEWGVSLLSLPGRAGMDLGLGLSYSSLVWTRSGPYAYFDEDRGSPSPGFRLGFASLRGPYFDAQVAKNVYVLVTSSGKRVSLRQVGTSNTYEAADSSYLQLVAGGSPLLRTTDGTQIGFGAFANGWQATSIKDRNGNYISVNYDWRGDIANITDTLGRVVTFNYDANANLSTITQTWLVNGVQQTHTWASFGWDTKALQPGFSSVAAVGAYSGEVIPVLSQVGLDDGSRYNFEYNSSGQVKTVRRYSSDNVERSRTAYDYATLADDCPRLIAARVSAHNWTGLNGVPAEVVTQFEVEGDGSHTMTAPDGTVYKDTYGTGWKRGLVTQSEVIADGGQQKLSTAEWVQDDTTVAYKTNPRVIETNVYDFPEDAPSNRRRTTIDYGPYAQYSLPHLVTEYDANGTTPLRQTYTDYNLAQGYLDRRIIGLVSMTRVYDPAAAKWLAKTTYAYDEAGSVSTQATAAPGHDQSFTSSFLTRGNVTAVSRWDAEDVDNASKTLTSHISYDAAGSVLTRTDEEGHQTSVAYADSFSDGNNSRGTFAYPTTLTDADGFSSFTQYNFDFGARTRVEGPPPDGQPTGLIQAFAYDGAARVERVTTVNNGAYTRYAYGPDYVATWAAVNTAADEDYALTVFDGLGRAVLAGSNNPGSAGGYKAQVTRYDRVGRAEKSSNPAEVNSSWNPAGDDAAGWVYTGQSYDWKGRPRITTNTDGTQRGATYAGCGCAGGEVVTLTDEVGRQRRVYGDALGRSRRTEVLNEDGTVYSTVTTRYDALDRAVRVREYAGEAPPPQSEPEGEGSGYQTTTMAYDGYGRLRSRHTPGQNAGVSTAYTYNADDTLNTVTDGRGAAATYFYENNNRRLVSKIKYTHQGTELTHTYTYDAAGNRKTATDGPGSGVTYQYDSLSRLTSEARTFGGLSHPKSPYTLVYTYNLAGQLETLTDPFGEKFTYQHDNAGRLFKVTGTAFANVTTYADGVQYRAWGGVKAATFGDGYAQTTTYDERMRPYQYRLGSQQREDFSYYPDGRLRQITDLDDGPGPTPPSTRHFMSRSYTYDHAGRVKYAGGTNTSPFQQNYAYDEFGNLTTRSGSYGYDGPWRTDTAQYTNGRRDGWNYDQDGRLIYSPPKPEAGGPARWWGYDAAGRRTTVVEAATGGGYNNYSTSYDCDGQTIYEASWGASLPTSSYYMVRSSVLGGEVVTRLNSSGGKAITYVPTGGLVEARQTLEGSQQLMGWTHKDPAGVTEWVPGREPGSEPAAYDPLGNFAGHSTLQPPQVQTPTYYGAWSGLTNSYNYPTGCVLDGRPASCAEVTRDINNHNVVPGRGHVYFDGEHEPEIRPLGPGAPPIAFFVDRRDGGNGVTAVFLGEPDDNLDFSQGPQGPVPQPHPTPAPPEASCVNSVLGSMKRLDRHTEQARQAATLIIKESVKNGLSDAQAAYVLATAEHESNMGNSMVEDYDFAAKQNYRGGPEYRGRGYTHLTHDDNYDKFGVKDNPDLAAVPERAAQIIVDGMMNGKFTGHRLDEYINNEGVDFVKARKTVLGLNRAKLIAGYAENYWTALKDCKYGELKPK